MKLKNFELATTVESIELLSEDVRWDLHNFARLADCCFFPDRATLNLVWQAEDVDNPWGCSINLAKGCRLEFSGVRSIQLLTDSQLLDEPCRLHGVSKVDKREASHRFKAEWAVEEPFNLLFEFTTGWTIEIDAEEVKLVPI